MKNRNISKMVKIIRRLVDKHSPELLTGIGIAGMITTAVMAVKATPKALLLIEEGKERINAGNSETSKERDEILHCCNLDSWRELKPLEIIKLVWTCYIPAIVIGSISAGCLIGASSVNIRRNTALATAYALSESAFKEYQQKVVEAIGEKKERTIKDEVAKEKIHKNPIVKEEIFITEKGNTLCFDTISGRYFKSDIDKLRKIENELNRQMLDEMYISLNDFYYEIGLRNTKIGDDLGWNIDDGYINLSFSSQLAEDGTPCLVLDYKVAPKYDYRKIL